MGGDGTWSGERKSAEPEGGQYCDSRWKFLFEETVFSAAQLIMCFSNLSVTFEKKKKIYIYDFHQELLELLLA